MLANTLAELGAATAPLAARLVANLPDADEPLFGCLLRALGNGLLDASDDAVDAVHEALPLLARAGRFYSPAADAPTFTWYEYVWLKRNRPGQPWNGWREAATANSHCWPSGRWAANARVKKSKPDGPWPAPARFRRRRLPHLSARSVFEL